MSCKAKINGEVTKRGEASIEFYKDGKPQYYCKGYVDNSTEELIETCKNCKENVRYAHRDLESFEKENVETEGNCYEESDFYKKKDIFDINPYE